MSTNASSYKSEYTQEEQLDRWSELIAYFRWYPAILLDWLRPTEIDKENNTYKTKYSYRRTTLEEWKEAKNRGTIKK